MLQSEDGIDWSVLPPPVFDWGDLPQQGKEVGGCQFIDGRYYLILSSRFGYLGNGGYSMFTCISEGPSEPFRPDLEAFRLCGTSSTDALWLAAFCRTPDETLISESLCREPIGPDEWFTPLKKAVVDEDRHLRIDYWRGNEAMKGKTVKTDPQSYSLLWPNGENEECRYSVENGLIQLHARRKGNRSVQTIPLTALLLDTEYDADEGVVLEGTMRVVGMSSDTLVKAHIRPSSAGLYIDTASRQGMAIQFETLGVTRIGLLDFSTPEPRFELQDLTGRGHATVARI